MLTHLGSLWERTDLWVAAEEIAAQLATAIEQDEQLDLVGGAAGCLISLTNLYRCSPSATVLSAALQCGEHLLQRSQFEGENGRGRWLIPPAKKLATFSGGTAGIAGALLELTTHTHDTRFRDAAIAAVQSELETTIAPQHNEFRSERTADSRDRDVTNSQWHQSEVGIGRAQLQMLPYLNHPALRAEIEAIVQATDDRGFGFNHSLGYGDLGNLDFLLQASGVLGQPHWAVRARQISTRVLANIEQCGLRCGVPLGTETPGLMTGLAGIGYGLLRLAEPKQLPSILTLSPPL
jgi:lantibiotic modifying enzyme